MLTSGLGFCERSDSIASQGDGASLNRGIPGVDGPRIVGPLTKWLSRYPDGTAGVALTLLRFACAWMSAVVIAHLASLQAQPKIGTVVATAVTLALVLGVGTRVLAFPLAACAITLASMPPAGDAVAMVARACGCAALGLLGPGAYSVDANLFGRRVIRLEPRPPDRDGDA